MAKKKKTRSKPRTFTKRLSDQPVETSKREWKKLGPVGKLVTGAFIASAVSVTWASQINALPVVGKWLQPVTGLARNLRTRMG